MKLKSLKNEDGAVTLLVALMMVLLIGFIAVVVDGGLLYLEKSKLQKSVDAAALAGAQQLQNGRTAAVQTTISIARKNGHDLSPSDIQTGADFVQVNKVVNKNLSFAKVLGISSSNVAAMAKAQVSGGFEDLIPIGIPESEIPSESDYSCGIHRSPGGKSGYAPIRGNFGFLDLSFGNGVKFVDQLKKGIKIEGSFPTEVNTYPGLSWGQVREGIQHRIDLDADKQTCNNYGTAGAECARVVTLPILRNFEDVHGKSRPVTIVGYATYWIEAPIVHQQVNGRIIAVYDLNGELPVKDIKLVQ
ncbi:pilus assembly protein TadG-related protein [Thalassobacillus hwangdonensis]|uniref:Pilus assembly protein TadG-related protein n=1 Tax=Thalassobacillus hwangdonensis TaxID=546108 RepID=A0ABW3L3Q6_9BACI